MKKIKTSKGVTLLFVKVADDVTLFKVVDPFQIGIPMLQVGKNTTTEWAGRQIEGEAWYHTNDPMILPKGKWVCINTTNLLTDEQAEQLVSDKIGAIYTNKIGESAIVKATPIVNFKYLLWENGLDPDTNNYVILKKVW